MRDSWENKIEALDRLLKVPQVFFRPLAGATVIICPGQHKPVKWRALDDDVLVYAICRCRRRAVIAYAKPSEDTRAFRRMTNRVLKPNRIADTVFASTALFDKLQQKGAKHGRRARRRS